MQVARFIYFIVKRSASNEENTVKHSCSRCYQEDVTKRTLYLCSDTPARYFRFCYLNERDANSIRLQKKIITFLS